MLRSPSHAPPTAPRSLPLFVRNLGSRSSPGSFDRHPPPRDRAGARAARRLPSCPGPGRLRCPADRAGGRPRTPGPGGVPLGVPGCNVPHSSGGSAESGAFFYQSPAQTVPGARVGLGLNLTMYYADSKTFFNGTMNYTMLTFLIASLTKYTDPCTGETMGWTLSLAGKGLGLTWFETGTSRSWSIPFRD